MSPKSLLTAALLTSWAASLAPPALAATIFESGTLGPTGVRLGEVDSTTIRVSAFNGVRFELDQPVRTTQVGGHFADTEGGTFFGAIVALEDEHDFPDSGDLSTDDVMGVAQLTFPFFESAEVFGDVDVRLEPGWYALVFGSGLFETDGQGGAIRNNPDIGEQIYINWQPGAPGDGWFNLIGGPIEFQNHRFVVKGTVVPEPGTVMLTLTALLLLRYYQRPRKH